MTVLVPDLKPRLPQLAPGTECCGCCDGIAPETPQAIENRHGLTQVAYRVGDHARFRASLHAALSSSAYAPLDQLLARDDADFTIGLIDAFASAADVLTFYQERLANESWLGTARERVSLQELGKLVGYRLRPGVAAETTLAFALDLAPAPPATLAPEPGSFVTGVPASLRLDAGLRVQSVPGPDEKPQAFELVETLDDARAQWNAATPWLSEPHLPGPGEREAWLAGTATGLRPGDALLLAGQDFLDDVASPHWDFRLLSAVEPDDANGRTRVAWTRPLGAEAPHAFVYALRRRNAVFGNNAPVWRSMNQEFRDGYAAKFGGTATQSEWQDFEISETAATAEGGAVDLDGLQAEIAADVATDVATDHARRSFAVLALGPFNRPDETLPETALVQPYRVTATTEVSRAAFAIAAKVTRLDLEGANLDDFFDEVRETSVFAKSDLLPLAERPVATPVAGDRIPVATETDGLLPGRRLIVRDTRDSDGTEVAVQATLVAVHPVAPGRAELEIDPALAEPLRRDSVVVHANVAPASHGESVSEVLGSGDGSAAFQRFRLKHQPLTHRAAENEIGAAPELTVRVADVAWDERPTLFGAAPADHAYTLTTDEQGRTFVQFGDGRQGARPPSGVNNVRATYRKGIGTEGNVAADKLTQLITRPLGLKGVSNPLPAEGGTDPEPAEAARQTIPLGTRTLGRVVSVLDYEDFARAYSGIAKAQARVLQVRTGPTVAITLAAPGGAALTEASPVRQKLQTALVEGGDPHVAVTLLDHQASTFRLGIRVKVDLRHDPDIVLPAVEAALRAHFSFDARALGQPVQQSDVIAVAHAVPGVVAVDLTRLYGGTEPPAQTLESLQVRLLASRMRVAAGAALPAELLTLDPAPLDQLEEMP